MDRKRTNQPQQPSLEEEVQRVLRAGEQAKHAEEEETFGGATATARERIQGWAEETEDTTRAAVDRVKDEMDHLGGQAAHTGNQFSSTAQHTANRAERAIYDAAESAQGTANDAKQAANSLVGQVKDKADDLAERVTGSDTGEIADTVRQKASQVGGQVADRTDAALGATGERLGDLADTVRANAPAGTVGQVATRAADALEQSGEYLQQHSTSDIVSDLTDLVRRRPLASMLVAVGIGYLFMRSRRRNDFYSRYRY